MNSRDELREQNGRDRCQFSGMSKNVQESLVNEIMEVWPSKFWRTLVEGD